MTGIYISRRLYKSQRSHKGRNDGAEGVDVSSERVESLFAAKDVKGGVYTDHGDAKIRQFDR